MFSYDLVSVIDNSQITYPKGEGEYTIGDNSHGYQYLDQGRHILGILGYDLLWQSAVDNQLTHEVYVPTIGYQTSDNEYESKYLERLMTT